MSTSLEFYQRVKIAGMLLMIPTTLAVAPLSAYWAAAYLQKKFAFSQVWCGIAAALGLAAGLRETIRIIRLVVNFEKDLEKDDRTRR